MTCQGSARCAWSAATGPMLAVACAWPMMPAKATMARRPLAISLRFSFSEIRALGEARGVEGAAGVEALDRVRLVRALLLEVGHDEDLDADDDGEGEGDGVAEVGLGVLDGRLDPVHARHDLLRGGAGDAEHRPAAVHDLRLLEAGELRGLLAETEGVEAVVAGKGAIEVRRGLRAGHPDRAHGGLAGAVGGLGGDLAAGEGAGAGHDGGGDGEGGHFLDEKWCVCWNDREPRRERGEPHHRC